MKAFSDINAMHFRKSVFTGETLFFFGVWPWPSTWTGYIITSEEDIAELKARLRKYQTVRLFVLGPLVAMLLALLVGSGSWPSGGKFVGQILIAIVAAFIAEGITSFVGKRFLLDPILSNCAVSQEKVTRRDLLEAHAATTGRVRAGHVMLTVLPLAGGLALLFRGDGQEDRITGILLIAVAVGVAVLAVKTAREERRRRERDAWMVKP